MPPAKVQLSAITRPALRYHGAKFRLAPWLLTHFPPHRCYVEAFGGAAGVLLQKPRSYAEVYNDLDGGIVNFFRVLQDTEQRARLTQLLVLTPYARAEFELAWQPHADPVERARRLLIRAQMGFGSAGASKNITGFRVDTQRAYGTAQQLWAEYPAQLAALAQRFTGVLIENRPALTLLAEHDAPDTLFYLDPPYVLDTRHTAGHKLYRHEMSDADHLALLDAVQSLQGMVILSGYPSALYDRALAGWCKAATVARIAAGRGGATRTECIWMNPRCVAAQTQLNLFG